MVAILIALLRRDGYSLPPQQAASLVSSFTGWLSIAGQDMLQLAIGKCVAVSIAGMCTSSTTFACLKDCARCLLMYPLIGEEDRTHLMERSVLSDRWVLH